MIYTIVGSIRKGKTSFLVCSVLKNILNAERLKKFRNNNQKLINEGFRIAQNNDFGLYSCNTLDIQYNDMRYIDFKSKKIDVKKLYLNSGLYIRNYSTIAIEEAQRYFPCREFSKFTTLQALFFQTCGHYNIDIFLDTQDLTNIDKNIRNISKIIDIKKFEIYNNNNNIVKYAKNNNFSHITYYIKEYQNISDYTAQKNATEKKQVFYVNPFSCYNSFNEDPLFYPQDKNIIIE